MRRNAIAIQYRTASHRTHSRSEGASYPEGVVHLLAALAFAVGAGVAGESTSSTATAKPVSLTITYWPDEQVPGTSDRWTVRCNPPGGTLSNRKTACRKLARLAPAAFAPVPPGSICTQVYGGPQKAVVRGKMGTQRIWASFRRRDGCEIDRWQRFSPWLLPVGSTTG